MRVREYVDQRTAEEKELELCTFKPQINETLPFVSDRTLRRLAEQRRLRAPPPPPPIISEYSNTNQFVQNILRKTETKDAKEKPFAGMFKRGQGLIKGPPSSSNVPMFYFDPFNPPNFTTGMYGNSPVPVSIINNPKPEVKLPPPPTIVNEEISLSSPPKGPNLVAPPLPPWVSAEASAKPAPKVNKIVIDRSKIEKKKEEPAAGGGWNSILAEMQKKAAARNGKVIEDPLLKKKEAAPPPKKLGGGTKKKGKPKFTDVMGELNYKLAKLRGEIPESEDEAEEEEPPNKGPPPPPPSTSAPPPPPPSDAPAPPPPAKEDTPSQPKKKVQASSALANLFAKKSTAPVAAQQDKPPPAGPPPPKTTVNLPIKIPPPSSSSSGPYINGPSNGAPMCTDPPKTIPAAPKLPSSWPPVPTKEVVKLKGGGFKPPAGGVPTTPVNHMNALSNALKKFRKPDEEETKSLKIEISEVTTTIQGVPTKPLPEGYYIAATKEGKVEPFDILPAGMVTEDILLHYINLFESPDKKEEETKFEMSIGRTGPNGVKYVDPNEANLTSQAILNYIYKAHRDCDTELDVSNKLTQHDLPVPSSYHSTIERFRKGIKKREELRELEKKLELRNYEDNTSPSSPTNSNPYGSRLKQTLNLLQSQAPNFETTRRLNEKTFTYRKPCEITKDDYLPQDEEVRGSYYMDIDNYTSSNGPTSHWMNSLRSTSTEKSRSVGRSRSTGRSRSRSVGRCDMTELEEKEIGWNPRVINTTHVLPASLESLVKPINPNTVVGRARTPKKNRNSSELTYWNKSISDNNSLFSPTKLSISALENTPMKSNSVSTNFGKTITKLTESRAPRLLSEEAAERRLANKELRELEEKNRQIEEAMREKERRERLKNQALRMGAEVKAYKNIHSVPPPPPGMTTTSCSINASLSTDSMIASATPSSPLPLNRSSQYHLKIAQKYSNIPGGKKLISLTENAYKHYAGQSIYSNNYNKNYEDNSTYYDEDMRDNFSQTKENFYPKYSNFDDENENFDLRENQDYKNFGETLEEEYEDYNQTNNNFSPYQFDQQYNSPQDTYHFNQQHHLDQQICDESQYQQQYYHQQQYQQQQYQQQQYQQQQYQQQQYQQQQYHQQYQQQYMYQQPQYNQQQLGLPQYDQQFSQPYNNYGGQANRYSNITSPSPYYQGYPEDDDELLSQYE